jgi:hypothetical protein
LDSISLILACFMMYISWFLRSILSFSVNFSERVLHSYFVLDNCSFSCFTLYSYSLSLRISFKAFVCSRLTLKRESFSSCNSLSYFCTFFN